MTQPTDTQPPYNTLNSTSTVPEQGQIAIVRQRHYLVADVQPATLAAKPYAVGIAIPQTLVSLNCIEDDGLGESLQVIWELEPGARVEEKVGLPAMTGFDPPDRFEAFLHAVKWGAISASDDRTLQAPFRSGIEIEDYQLDPLVRAVQMPRANLLIADDVGLGKTIEAGLIIQELIVRNRARTALIICPASLQAQWRDQMRDKFGLAFRIVDAELMRVLRRTRGIHANPWTHFPRLITSIDFLKRDRPLRLLRETLPGEGAPRYPRKFDLLVLDEAHNVAPSGRGKYATDSQRTAAIRVLTPHFEHKLFLSATPHNGYKESFSALLELLDDQRFARDVQPDPQQLGAVMVRRMKTEIKNWEGRPRFPMRHVAPLEVTYTDAERQAHGWLNQYAHLRLQQAQGAAERVAAEFVLKLLKKRLFSSPAAFAITLAQHVRTATGTKQAADPKPNLRVLRQSLDIADEDHADDGELDADLETSVMAATTALRTLPPEATALLKQLADWAGPAAKRADSKAKALLEWLKQTLKPAGQWNNERVIIFTEYRDTQKWLQDLLVANGLAEKGRLEVIYGGQLDDRERIKAAFQAHPADSAVRILLATDAASEGVDLQNHCHRVVHIEIPWNPNRLEQRNGRVDRHGQQYDPLVYHFVGAGYQNRTASSTADVPPGELEADLEFLMRAAQKIEQIREDLGKVGPVIAAQVEQAMLGQRRKLDTTHAERESEPIKRQLKFERDLQKDIARHMEQLRETQRALDLTPAHVQAVVTTALALDGQLPLLPVKDRAGEFDLPALKGSWATCAEGLAHPHTGVMRPIVFDHEQARGRDDVVLAHLNHRLVQKALRLLRAAVWAPQSGLHRCCVRVVPNTTLDTPAVIAHARLVVVGGHAHRLHEEVITAGGLVREGRFRRMNVGDTKLALDAVVADNKTVAESETVKMRLMALWPNLAAPLMTALEARAKDRLDGMHNLLAEREHREKTNLHIIMGQLQKAISLELADDNPQLAFEFSEDELNQRRVNRDALRRRLNEIPGELTREQAAVAARFADPQPRLFPVAVTFLVPQKLM